MNVFRVFSSDMKKDIHPKDYRQVIFDDSTSGKRFLIASTVATTKKDKWDDGKEYPVYHVEISSASHPFYTGHAKTIDTAGRVDKFNKRLARQATAEGAAAGKPKVKTKK